MRQGGIMSPVLFNIYMDDPSVCLNNSKIGCSMNGVITNLSMYADDTCFIAPSPSALPKLLGMCVNFLSVILLNLMKVKPNICVLNRRINRVYMCQAS